MLRMFLRHLLVNVCSLWVLVLGTRRVTVDAQSANQVGGREQGDDQAEDGKTT